MGRRQKCSPELIEDRTRFILSLSAFLCTNPFGNTITQPLPRRFGFLSCWRGFRNTNLQSGGLDRIRTEFTKHVLCKVEDKCDHSPGQQSTRRGNKSWTHILCKEHQKLDSRHRDNTKNGYKRSELAKYGV